MLKLYHTILQQNIDAHLFKEQDNYHFQILIKKI